MVSFPNPLLNEGKEADICLLDVGLVKDQLLNVMMAARDTVSPGLDAGDPSTDVCPKDCGTPFVYLLLLS